MSKQIQTQIDNGKARIVDAPVAKAAAPIEAPAVGVPAAALPAAALPEIDRSFGLPKELYIGTVAGYFGFLAITAAAFMNPVLIIPMVIFAVFIVAGFGVPTIFTQLKGNDSKAMGWGEFANKGIMTATGPLAAREASVQVLILPVLIVLWGIAAVTIAAIVA